MSDIFISYARSTAAQAQAVAEALRALGYGVWRDDDLPAHRGYAEVIEERLRDATAVVVIWSAEAARSEWVQSEADRARADHKLVQLRIDDAVLPMPFDRIQCADLTGWSGDLEAAGWRKVVSSLADLIGAPAEAAVADAPLALPTKPSIAVLPFANLSGDPEQDYFADGMVVEITSALSRSKSIFVIASGSTLSLKGQGVSPKEAARRLGVRYVLEGSVRKAGGRVRITVQLIDATDGAQIWTNRFEDTLEDVFELQDRVALSVAGVIEPAVQQVETRRASARPTENMGSYDLYLRALHHRFAASREANFVGLDLLNRAIALDPEFGPALSLAATFHQQIVVDGWSDDPDDNRRQGVALARRALRAAPDDAGVIGFAAIVLSGLAQEYAAARTLAERAIELNPGSAMAWMLSGFLLGMAGETDLAVEQLETSMRLDPLGPNRPMQLGYLGGARFAQRRFSEAVTLLKEAAHQWEIPGVLVMLAAGYGHLGDQVAARAALARCRAISPTPVDVLARAVMRYPEHLDLLMEGLALAEGASPAGSAVTTS